MSDRFVQYYHQKSSQKFTKSLMIKRCAVCEDLVQRFPTFHFRRSQQKSLQMRIWTEEYSNKTDLCQVISFTFSLPLLILFDCYTTHPITKEQGKKSSWIFEIVGKGMHPFLQEIVLGVQEAGKFKLWLTEESGPSL